jgi:hypothetical protein
MRFAWLACGLGLFLPSLALACGKGELQTLIDSAQSLAPETEAQAAKLVSCPNEVAATIQWLAFFRAVGPGANKTVANIRAVAPNTGAPKAISNDITQAYIGSYTNLKAKFDSGDPTYRDEPQVYLALARALVRHGDFIEGRSFYASYLRLVRSTYAEEIENLYSYIWEGRLEQAQHDLDNADFTDTPPEYRRAIDHGKDLVQRLRAAGGKAEAKANVQKPAMFTADLEGFAITDELQRLSTGLSYHGVLDASWHHHLIRELSYDKSTLNTDEFLVGADHTFGNRVNLTAHLGYLTSADQHYLGDARLRLRVKNQLWLGAGTDRQALLTTVPLTSNALGLLQDRTYIEGGWPGWLIGRSAYLRDQNRAAFQRHEIELRQPLKSINSGDSGAEVIGVSALALYEARPQPSPDYDSDHSTAKLGLGAFAEQHLGADWAINADIQYLLAQVQPFGSNTTRQLSGAEIKTRLSDRIADNWFVTAAFTYSARETGRPSQTIEQRMAIFAAIELRP